MFYIPEEMYVYIYLLRISTTSVLQGNQENVLCWLASTVSPNHPSNKYTVYIYIHIVIHINLTTIIMYHNMYNLGERRWWWILLRSQHQHSANQHIYQLQHTQRESEDVK